MTGARWTAVSLKGLLIAPRVAGLVVYQGESLDGVAASWPAILEREQWEAVRHIVTDPVRRTSPGSQPRWLGSHLYVCGHPDHDEEHRPTLKVSTAGGGPGSPYVRSYRCRASAHLVRAVGPLDDYVTEVMVERLSRPDAVDLLSPKNGVDTTAWAREANVLRQRITEAGDLWESGVIGPGELKVRCDEAGFVGDDDELGSVAGVQLHEQAALADPSGEGGRVLSVDGDPLGPPELADPRSSMPVKPPVIVAAEELLTQAGQGSSWWASVE